MNNVTVSLCIIAKNEEETIARCIHSAKGAVEEIIVVDTGSTDGTIEAARKAGAQVYSRPWRNDFAWARNESLNLASGDWLLVLDADESLEDGSVDLLRKLIGAQDGTDGYFVQIVNQIGVGNKQVGSSTSSALRLFRNKPGYRYEGRIHEQIVQPILQANSSAVLQYSAIRLNHGGYLPEVVQKKNKVQRNMELLQRELENSSNESFHRYNLGVEYMRARQYEKALEQFRLSRTVTDWRRASFGHVVVLREMNCLQALGEWEQAAAFGGEASEALADFPDLFLAMGRIYYRLHRWVEAADAFRQALSIGAAPPKYTSESGAGTYSASFYLGKTYEQLQDYEQAAACYAGALRFHPGLLPPFLRLVGLLSRLGGAGRITDRLERLLQLESPKTWWSTALSYYMLGLYEQAEELLRTKPMPREKRKEQLLLLMRCKLLQTPGSVLATVQLYRPPQLSGITMTRLLRYRYCLYAALAQNDDKAALRWLERLRTEYARPGAHSDPAVDALLPLFSFLVTGEPPAALPATLPESAYSGLWSELYFLYTLAAGKHLFGLQAQVLAYWRSLLHTLPDPVHRLKGRYELVKTVHVRIYHLFSVEKEAPEYAALWNEARPKLTALIDDLLMEEAL